MRTELSEFIVKLLTETKKNDLIVSDEKVIDFGVQLKFSINEEEIPLNIYFSSKKGISTVIGGAPNNKLRPLLQKILDQRIDPVRTDHNWKLWAGTDESGKGDFFGPLVVCGFICNQAMLPTLKKLGVKDSKLLKDGDIEKIAKQLYARFFVNIETIILHPSKYNELYEQFRKQNKKLNELLAWMHGRVILNLKKNHKFEGAVVDRFASDKTLLSSLKDLKKIKLQHRIKAEDDLAVASASIIARYLFLKKMKELSEKYDLELPKGASEKVVKTASEFVAKYGKEKLREVAKIHFKTFQKI
jgi:ribonuclease HIII